MFSDHWINRIIKTVLSKFIQYIFIKNLSPKPILNFDWTRSKISLRKFCTISTPHSHFIKRKCIYLIACIQSTASFFILLTRKRDDVTSVLWWKSRRHVENFITNSNVNQLILSIAKKNTHMYVQKNVFIHLVPPACADRYRKLKIMLLFDLTLSIVSDKRVHVFIII